MTLWDPLHDMFGRFRLLVKSTIYMAPTSSVDLV